MFEYKLFFGLPVDPIYEKKLDQVDPALVGQFIQNDGDYLQQVNYEGMRYLGKPIGKLAELEYLESLETNIVSILKKIVPDYRYDEIPLMLFPLPNDA